MHQAQCFPPSTASTSTVAVLVLEMKVAVIGAGISGLVSAYVLAKAGVNVVLFEKEDHLGGHAKSVTFDGVDLDLGFLAFNSSTYPKMMEMFEDLEVDMEPSNMSLSVSLDESKGYEWGSKHGVSSLFSQKSNVLNPYFWQMLREITKFKDDVLSYLEVIEKNSDIDRNETLGHFLKSRGYSELFQKAYLVPICCSIWASDADKVLSFSAYTVLKFCLDHHLLQVLGHPQWLAVKGGSRRFVDKVKNKLEAWGCQIRTSCGVKSVLIGVKGCSIVCEDDSQEMFTGCIMAIHHPDVLTLLGNQVTFDESRILGAFQYVNSDVFLHRDKKFMPTNPAAWSACNFLGSTEKKACLTYWLNELQSVGEKGFRFLITLNPDQAPKSTLLKWSTSHPIPSIAATKASLELDLIQGKRGVWFCEAYQGYGFQENGIKAGMVAANSLLGRSYSTLENPKHMVPSLMETGARIFVTRFLKSYISTGSVILLEEGGTTLSFEGYDPKCNLKAIIKVHNPQFYWKVMTQADLGLADAFINGDISFVDKNEGLLHFIMILIANRDLNLSIAKLRKNRGWWTPMLLTAGVASAKYFFKHVSRQNTLTQARRNISLHYDLSNELFALFLDETMQYSCAVFEKENEDLKVAQERKISLLIKKARINSKHEVLEIGCGWGSLAIEIVKRTGCRYTGITLSLEQLKYAEAKVKESELQDRITFQLSDYRQLSSIYKYDRIISCEMIEAVGHEYLEEFFGSCESALAEDGLLVLQFSSMPDERYEGYRLSSEFIKEYIFPGCCVPSLSRITSAMATASRLSVEHAENIGIHFYTTLGHWRKNFLENQSEIRSLGFDEKFIRAWEYYFDYCRAGFKSRTLGNYQVVFSRPGNVAALGDLPRGLPSAN